MSRSWGVPLAITVAAVALKKIGYDASDVSVGWCWINLEAEDRLLWMLLTGKLWEMLAYVALPVLYLLIRKHINRAVGARFPRTQSAGWPWCPTCACTHPGLGVGHLRGQRGRRRGGFALHPAACTWVVCPADCAASSCDPAFVGEAPGAPQARPAPGLATALYCPLLDRPPGESG